MLKWDYCEGMWMLSWPSQREHYSQCVEWTWPLTVSSLVRLCTSVSWVMVSLLVATTICGLGGVSRYFNFPFSFIVFGLYLNAYRFLMGLFFRWSVIIWDWEWRRVIPTSTTARRATHLWTWRRSTREFSGRRTSFLSSRVQSSPKKLWRFNNATLSCPRWWRRSLAPLILTLTSLLMLWWLGLKLGMSLTRPLKLEQLKNHHCSFGY